MPYCPALNMVQRSSSVFRLAGFLGNHRRTRFFSRNVARRVGKTTRIRFKITAVGEEYIACITLKIEKRGFFFQNNILAFS